MLYIPFQLACLLGFILDSFSMRLFAFRHTLALAGVEQKQPLPELLLQLTKCCLSFVELGQAAAANCGVRRAMASGKRQTANGEWQMANGNA